MAGKPWEKYSAPTKDAAGPWAKYTQPEVPAENTPNFLDKAQEFGSGLMDNVNEFTEAVNPLAPLAHVAGNAVGALLDPDKTYDQYVADDNKEAAARKERTSIVPGIVGTIRNPLNTYTGMAGVGAGVAANAANNELSAAALNSGKSQGDIAQEALVEGGLGTAINGASKLVKPAVKWAKGLSGGLDEAAENQVKKGFNATTAQMAEWGVKGDEMDDAAKLMLKSGFYDKPIQSQQDLYNALRARMTKTGEGMDLLADQFGEGVKRGELSDLMHAKGAEARKIGQSGLESNYQNKGQAFLSPETVAAEKGIKKIDKALNKPQLEFDQVGDQNKSLGRRAEIQDTKQKLLDEADLRDDSLKRQLQQQQIDHQLASIDERGGYIGAKQDFNEAQQTALLESRANLQDVLDDGRDEILSTSDLRKARKAEDARAYPSQFSVDPDKAEIAGTLREAEMNSIKDPEAKSFYQHHKDEYSTLVPAEKMTQKAAARDEAKTLLGSINNKTGRIVGGALGTPFGVPGAIIGQQLGGYAQELTSKYGNQMAAYGFNKTSKVLQNEGWAKTLLEAGKRGGSAGISTAHFLMTQRDPAYRQAHQEDQDASKDQ